MEEDELGFIYPKIDESLCVECGACKRVCAYQSEMQTAQPQSGYAAVNKDKRQGSKSSSGGLFAALATYVLGKDGVVYGAAYDYQPDKVVVRHIGITSTDELPRLQGSKYVQSYMGDTYKHVRANLKQGRRVLFSGTPCQVAALKRFLRVDYDNLFTIDIICHGVPSQRFFNDYLHCLERKTKTKIGGFSFRDKSKPWKDYHILYDCKCHEEYGNLSTHKDFHKKIWWKHSSYFYYFIKMHTFRINCYSCQYATSSRTGDITLGDYWGIETQHSELFKLSKWIRYWFGGISCVLVNTSKGTELLRNIAPYLDIQESTPEKIIWGNGQLKHPSPLNENERSRILGLYRGKGYEAVDTAFEQAIPRKEKTVQAIKELVPVSVKRFIKLIFRNIR